MPLIEVEGLSYRYPKAKDWALKSVDLSVDRGEFVVLTGPTGCGKTTLCRCLNGLIPHFYGGEMRGEVRVAGLPVKENPISTMARHVGMIFQNPDNQIFALTVEKDVAFGLENLGLPREEIRRRVDWALRVTGIEAIRNRGTHELSGGQKQRLAIASVLAMKPEVIVLDEPTAYLDPKGAEEIMAVVDGLRREFGMTVILVEHRMDIAARYADRVVVMEGGQVVLDGEPAEVLSSQEAVRLGVDVPRVVRLHRRLSELGVDLGAPTVMLEELAERVREAMRG